MRARRATPALMRLSPATPLFLLLQIVLMSRHISSIMLTDIAETGRQGPFCNIDPLTFITVPKPQIKERHIRRSIITIASWLSFPEARVVLASEENIYDPSHRVMPAIKQAFGDAVSERITFTGELPSGYNGRPLVREWFRVGFETVTTGYRVFLNGDILVSREWMQMARRIFATLKDKRKVIIIGTRTDVHLQHNFYKLQINSSTLLPDTEEYCAANVARNNVFGMDLFMVHSSMEMWNISDFPEYVVGLCVWDNFFMAWANSQLETVTMNFDPLLCHVNHERNACNKENFVHFGNVTESWHVKLRLQRHYHAHYLLDKNRSVLVTKRRPPWIPRGIDTPLVPSTRPDGCPV